VRSVAAAVSSTPSGALGIAALVAWLVTAGIGAAMLAALISRGDLRQQRAVRGGLPPAYLVGHFSLALTGLAVWISYLAAGWTALAWTAVGILILAIGLGISTVTLWTPFPGPRGTAAAGRSGGAGDAHSVQETPPASAEDAPARKVSDEVLARALNDEVLADQLVDQVIAGIHAEPTPARKRPGRHWAVLVPVAHGLAAMATFILVVVTAASAS
jgi:hypothetical protein